MSSVPKTQGQHNFSPVKQNEADGFLLLVISSFGITLILVRMFLELTGYPQVGDTTFHIAHVLWGGLLLFLAVLMLLILANPWAHWVAAALGGIGTGLFIDEVGKFITQSNDYFYPLAFPLIYGFLVVCVWLYFRVRRSDPRDRRTLFYHAFENFKDVLDNNLDLSEQSDLIKGLNQVTATGEDVSEGKLAVAMLEYVKKRERHALARPNWFERMYTRVMAFAAATPSRETLKIVLIIGFVLLGIGEFAKWIGLYSIASNTAPDWRAVLSSFVVVNGKSRYVVNHPGLLLTNIFFIAMTGILAFGSAVMLARGNERFGLRVGSLGLVFALTIVNPITFYFSQLYAMADALGQLALIGLAQIYRWRFFLNPTQAMSSMEQGEVAERV